MSNWEVESRAMIKASKEFVSAILPVPTPLTDVPPLVLMSSVEGTHFPIHLDVVRVLIRMMPLVATCQPSSEVSFLNIPMRWLRPAQCSSNALCSSRSSSIVTLGPNVSL